MALLNARRRRGAGRGLHTLERGPLRCEPLEDRRLLDALGCEVLKATDDAFEDDDVSEQARLILPGEAPQVHSIYPVGDVDWIKFTISETSAVVLETDGPSGGDTQLWLYGPNDPARQVAFNEDGGNGWYSRIVTVVEPGTYYGKVGEYGNNNALDSYTLALTATPLSQLRDAYEVDDTADQARVLTAGAASQVHSIHSPSDVDWLRFTVSQPLRASLTIDRPEGSAWLSVKAYGPDSTTAQVLSTSVNDYQEAVQFDVRPGTYYVRIAAYYSTDICERYTAALTLTPLPDLDVVSLAVLGEEPLALGEPATLVWTVENIGPAPTHTWAAGGDSMWSDQVYLSEDAVLGGDVYLTSWYYSSEALQPGQRYNGADEVTLPRDARWGGKRAYLLVVADGGRSEAELDETNNVAALAVELAPFVAITDPYEGQFVDTSHPVTLGFTGCDAQQVAQIDLAVDEDADPRNGTGHQWILQGESETDAQGRTISYTFSNLTPRQEPYYVWARLRGPDRTAYSQPIPIYMYPLAAVSVDPLNDTIGGDEYEVFGVEAAQAGHQIHFRIRTNYDPASKAGSGGDIRIESGGTVYGLALSGHSVDDGSRVIAGDLYVGAEFRMGSVVGNVPAFIRSYTAHISHRSWVTYHETTGDVDWGFEIEGGFEIEAVGGYATGQIVIRWSMWCGNDTDDVPIDPEEPPENHPPIAVNDPYFIPQDALQWTIPADRGVLANDSDPDGDRIVALWLDGPANGVLELYPNGSFVYQPNRGFRGTDCFRYQAYDGQDVSNIAVVQLDVGLNVPPITLPNQYPTVCGGVFISPNSVLDNDVDPNGDSLSARVLVQAMHGWVTMSPTGHFIYQPAVGFHGIDTFTYGASDSEYETRGLVTILVYCQEPIIRRNYNLNINPNNPPPLWQPAPYLPPGVPNPTPIFPNRGTILGGPGLKGETDKSATDYTLVLCDEALRPLATSRLVEGRQRIDWEITPNATYAIRVLGTEQTVPVTLCNLVNVEANGVTVYGTDQADQIEILMGQPRLTVNGVSYPIEGLWTRRVTVLGGDGRDQLTLIGSTEDQTATLSGASGTITLAGWTIEFSKVESVILDGGGGNDAITLSDSAGNDTLTATPRQVTFAAGYCTYQVQNYDTVHVRATRGGRDRAELYDGPGNDTFLARPTYAIMTGLGYWTRATGFEEVTGYGTGGGINGARMYDSSGNDVFEARQTNTTMTGPGYKNTAQAFRSVYAYAFSAGNDVAHLYGTSTDDTLVGRPSYAQITGRYYTRLARAFDQVYAHASAGRDFAYLYDSEGDDTFIGRREEAILSGRGYALHAELYEVVRGTGSQGNDVADLYAAAAGDRFDTAGADTRLFGADYTIIARAFDTVRTHSIGSKTAAVDAALLDAAAWDGQRWATAGLEKSLQRPPEPTRRLSLFP